LITPLAIIKLPLQIITARTAKPIPIKVFFSEEVIEEDNSEVSWKEEIG
jgi:hypothetical protein